MVGATSASPTAFTGIGASPRGTSRFASVQYRCQWARRTGGLGAVPRPGGCRGDTRPPCSVAARAALMHPTAQAEILSAACWRILSLRAVSRGVGGANGRRYGAPIS